MPLGPEDLPSEAQVAFFIYNHLQPVYAGMEGVFVGKDWSMFDSIYDMVWEDKLDKRLIFELGKFIETVEVAEYLKKREKEQKRANQKAQDGKKYAHNVSG